MRLGARRTARREAVVALLMLAGLAGLLGGCATTGATGPRLAADQVFKGELVTGGSGGLQTLDPDIVTDPASQGVIALVFDTLVTLNASLQPGPWGADRIGVSADGLTYTFHIRAGQAFSDGMPVRASDYAYSLNRALDPCLASSVSYYLFPIKDAETFAGENCKDGVIVIGQHQSAPLIQTLLGSSIVADDAASTLTLTLAQPAGYFLAALTYPTSAALEARVVGSDLSTEKWQDHLSDGPTGQGGSGMYYVAAWQHTTDGAPIGYPGDTLRLKLNPHWWGLKQGMRPHLTEIDWTTFAEADASAAATAYQNGTYSDHFVANDQLASARGAKDYHDALQLTETWLAMNWQAAPLANADVRQALCLAINRDALAQQAVGLLPTLHVPIEMQPTWHLVPQGMQGYNPNLTGPDGVTATTGDQAKATQHWDAYLASLKGAKPPTMTVLYYPGGISSQALAESLQSQWQRALGITVRVHEVYGGYLNDSSTPAPEMISATWRADYPDPQDFLSLNFASTGSDNVDNVSVPAADTLLSAADASGHSLERLIEYQQAEQVLVGQAAACPLFQAAIPYQVHPNVVGWSLSSLGFPTNDTWLRTYIAA